MIGKPNVVLLVRKCVCECGVAVHTIACPLQCPGSYRRMFSFECTRFRTKLANYVAKFVTLHILSVMGISSEAPEWLNAVADEGTMSQILSAITSKFLFIMRASGSSSERESKFRRMCAIERLYQDIKFGQKTLEACICDLRSKNAWRGRGKRNKTAPIIC